ncbi:tyrosine-protein phosphatase non-receptor type 14-like isoform X1 [Clavelina lepadiformis]|uniref:tyrosine-protein phosphatase non-receptor type 14-like isoform X1 n=1 Tax=Clavelina lepadiformis TaxID=159417 RepID=UPI004042EEC1
MPMLDKALNSVIMPFGIKLKRGRYILSHKNSFLIHVQLLDNTPMEYTLTVENTGNDCLNAVAQKLELKEVKYFGLHYFNKQSKIRWVELDKPLKKQVDKNALEPNLYFGVMFYVANIDSLQQEITRYLFYLQLKNNVINGFLQCNNEEVVELASYVLQAEFGDHDPGTHIVGYFRDYILFPEDPTTNQEHLDSLTSRTIECHKRHRGLSPSDAEYNYILKAIHLVGFSEDMYHAKNGLGNDVEVGCSFAGVVIKSVQHDPAKVISVCHEWQTIEHIANAKNQLSLEVRREDSSLSLFLFQMDDSDTAKYLWRLCESRKKFYQQNKDTTRQVSLDSEEEPIIQRRPTLRRNLETESDDMKQQMVPAQAGADFVSSQENIHLYNSNEIRRYYSSETSLDHPYVSQSSLNQQPQPEAGYSNGFGGSMYSLQSINSLAQSHVGRPSPATSNLSINASHQRPGQSIAVPIYRPSPDYDVALRQRRRYSSFLENNPNMVHQSTNPQHVSTNIPQPSLKPRPHSMIYSQQELVQQAKYGPHYAQYPQQHPPLHYRRSQPPLDPNGQVPSHIHWDTSHESLSPTGGSQVTEMRFVGANNARDLRAMAGSTPELAVQQQQKPMFVSEMQLYRHFAKPTPNTHQGAASTSTPDLSVHRQNAVSASSPDLHLDNAGGQPSRLHRPLPPVESYAEDTYNQQQQILVHGAINHLTQSPERVMMISDPHSQVVPSSSSFDRIENRSISQREQTPEQNVQAYLEQVSYAHHNPANDVTSYSKPYKRPLAGSRERLIQEEDAEQNYGSNSRIPAVFKEQKSQQRYHNYRESEVVLRQNQSTHKQVEYHHSKAPSNATMLVYSSDSDSEVTSDYLLSQQLQDQAMRQVRTNRSQEYLGPEQAHLGPSNRLVQSMQQLNIAGYLQGADQGGTQKVKEIIPPPPYPKKFVQPESEPQHTDPKNAASQGNPQNFIHHNKPGSFTHSSDPQNFILHNSPQSYSNNYAPHGELEAYNTHKEPKTFIPQNGEIFLSQEEPPSQNRGPPPPYHTPSPSTITKDNDLQVEDVEEEIVESGELFQHARRSTIRKMAPLKFAAMNGLNVNKGSSSPAKGEHDERALNLEAKVEEGHVLTEYDQIPRTRAEFELEHLASRDRIKEVVPYSDCRVEVSPSIDNPCGYINASHVKSVVAGEQWHYIAAQTPLENHQNEMWDMVWRNRTSIIVLITKEIEHGKPRCARYWPNSDDNPDIPYAAFGNYRVMCRFDNCSPSSDHQSRTTRNLVLEKVGSNEARTVWMLQYLGWPETGVPKETDDFLAFVKELESVRRLAQENTEYARSRPVLVQCSSGSGRTGVLILAELMVQCLEHNQDTTVPEMLTTLREQRMHMVQTFSQYNFVYNILISFLRKSRLI